MENPQITHSEKKGKVLVVLSGENRLKLANGKYVDVGYFLSELMKPLKQIVDAGLEIVFSTPYGRPPKLDKVSDWSFWYLFNWNEYKKDKELHDRLYRSSGLGSGYSMSTPRALSSFGEQELDSYCGLFVPGGHAPLIDLYRDEDLGRIIKHFHDKKKPIGMICHGPVSLLSTKMVDRDKPWAFEGYRLTCFSDWEECFIEWLFWGNMPLKVQSRLAESGAKVETTWPLVWKKVVKDRELTTGQNPWSVWQFSKEFVEELKKCPATDHDHKHHIKSEKSHD